MKTIKRMVCITLALIMLFAVVSCKKETPAEAIKKATINSAAEGGYHVDGEYRISMSANGTIVPITVEMSEDFTLDPLSAKISMVLDMGLFGKMDETVYVEATGDDYTIYVGLDAYGETYWSKQTATNDDIKELTSSIAADSLEMYESIEFTEVGKDEINGVNATHYSGILTGEFMKDVLESSGMGSQLEGLGLTDEVFDGISGAENGIKLDIWVSEDHYLVRTDMDMSELMSELISAFVASYGEEAEGLTMDVTEAVVSMTYSKYGEVDPITVPEEVKQQATEVDY